MRKDLTQDHFRLFLCIAGVFRGYREITFSGFDLCYICGVQPGMGLCSAQAMVFANSSAVT